MLTKEQLNKFAEKAGFGGNQRNTYRVKLELFAAMVEAATLADVQQQLREAVEQWQKEQQ